MSSTKIKIGSKVVTVNHRPMAFLVGMVSIAVLVGLFAPEGKAELLLAPTGFLALIAQGVMREAFKIEGDPGTSDAAPTEPGK